jgi:hypothetical protein
MVRPVGPGEPEKASADQGGGETSPAIPPAWEQIEAGRYRPRRIRGSFPGRELG